MMRDKGRAPAVLAVIFGLYILLHAFLFVPQTSCTAQDALSLFSLCLTMGSDVIYLTDLLVGTAIALAGVVILILSSRSHAKAPARDLYVHGSLDEFRNDRDDEDKYYIPGRSLAFRREGSIHVLPDDDEGRERRYSEQLERICGELGLGTIGKTLFVPDSSYLLDVAVVEAIDHVEADLPSNVPYRVVPFGTTKPLRAWAYLLQADGYDVEVSMPDRIYYDDLRHPSHRGGWGRQVRYPERRSFPERNRIPYPKAYVGQGIDEILEAYDRVTSQTGMPDAWFKPVFSAGGFTLRKVHSRDDVADVYRELKAQEALDILGKETPVEIQENLFIKADGYYSIQYDGETIVSPSGLTKQIMSGSNWQGNVFNDEVPAELVQEAAKIFERLCRGMRRYRGTRKGTRLRGLGGLDLAVTTEGRLMVLEHNGRRMTGAQPAIDLAATLGIRGPFVLEKTSGKPGCDLLTLWEVLKAERLHFDPTTKTGIFPVVFMPGSGMLLAAARTAADARIMLAQANQALRAGGYLVDEIVNAGMIAGSQNG